MSEDIKCSCFIKTSKKSEKPKIIFSKPRIEKIREKFMESRLKFSKPKINEIRRNLYEIENKKNLSAPKHKKDYLDIIRPYLRDIINDHKTQGERRIHSGSAIIKHKTQNEWKIQLTMEINFISSKPDSDETRTMYTKSNNVEIMMGSETDEIIKGLF